MSGTVRRLPFQYGLALHGLYRLAPAMWEQESHSPFLYAFREIEIRIFLNICSDLFADSLCPSKQFIEYTYLTGIAGHN